MEAEGTTVASIFKFWLTLFTMWINKSVCLICFVLWWIKPKKLIISKLWIEPLMNVLGFSITCVGKQLMLCVAWNNCQDGWRPASFVSWRILMVWSGCGTIGVPLLEKIYRYDMNHIQRECYSHTTDNSCWSLWHGPCELNLQSCCLWIGHFEDNEQVCKTTHSLKSNFGASKW